MDHLQTTTPTSQHSKLSPLQHDSGTVSWPPCSPLPSSSLNSSNSEDPCLPVLIWITSNPPSNYFNCPGGRYYARLGKTAIPSPGLVLLLHSQPTVLWSPSAPHSSGNQLYGWWTISSADTYPSLSGAFLCNVTCVNGILTKITMPWFLITKNYWSSTCWIHIFFSNMKSM